MADISWLTKRPIAHRGLHDGNKAVWENTLSAFEAAAAKGYTIECDVHLTGDGSVVVFHDNELKRLTGTDGFVWQRTLAEMQALRIGTGSDRAPSLQEALDLVAGRVPVVVEVKGIPGHDAGLVEKVGAILAGYGGPAAVMSFDHWIVREFEKHIPGRPAGLTAWGTAERDLEAHFSMLAHNIAFTSFDIAGMPNRFTAFLREKLSMPVITWTIRDEAAAAKTFAHADQMTFEGFDPGVDRVA